MEIGEIKNLTDNINGWLTDREGVLLHNLAFNCKGRGVIVEIGSWKGKSTIWLGRGSKAGKNMKIYAIDPHTGSSEHKGKCDDIFTFEEFNRNVKDARVDDVIIPLVSTSQEAAENFDKPVEMIFIDGSHEYEFVKSDFELWFPKVVEGGVVAFHDTIEWAGPRKVVEESLFKSKYFKNIGYVDSITFAEKVSRNSLRDRLRNRHTLFIKNLYRLEGRLNLPGPIMSLLKKFAKLLFRPSGGNY